MIIVPPQRQTSIKISDSLVKRGSLSHAGPRMPKAPSAIFRMPYSGLSTHINSMALATTGTTVGR